MGLKLKIILLQFTCATLIFSVVGCESAPNVTYTTAVVGVEARAQQRWGHLLKGEYEKAYSLLSPTSRDSITLEQFKNRNKTTYWNSTKITGTKCDGDSCVVSVELVYDLRDIKNLKKELIETWVKVDSVWFMVYAPGASGS